ncbi:MAG: hypothetical protein KC931_25820, partial [Candidatus Omnitrophica bacterium]|nr:hypothetical protein [Candidatus Omnitrophota bacterium]
PPPHPRVRCRAPTPENTARLIHSQKFEQLGMSYVRTPRRRLWVTELACRKKFDSVPPTQNSEET